MFAYVMLSWKFGVVEKTETFLSVPKKFCLTAFDCLFVAGALYFPFNCCFLPNSLEAAMTVIVVLLGCQLS